MTKVFVTGATGTIGSEVVNALNTTSDASVTAASRTPRSEGDVAYARFDFADPATYAAADGHDAVFLLGPPLEPGLFDLLAPFVDYLAENGRPRVTYLSANGMDQMKELPFHKQMEEKLAASGLDVTVLRPGFFATNFANYERENVEQRGVVFNPAGAGKTAFVDPADVGAAAAVTLTRPEHAGRTYTLTGPVAYTMHEMAAAIGEITGKTIVYPEPSNEEYRAALAAGGAPPFVADYMIPVYNLIRNGAVEEVHPDLERLLGRKTTDARRVLERGF